MKSILIGLTIFSVLITVPTAAMATVLDLSGESSGGDTSGNFLPRAPANPNFPGTGPGFQDIPSPSAPSDDGGSNSNNFDSPPPSSDRFGPDNNPFRDSDGDGVLSEDEVVNQALDQIDPFCKEMIQAQENGQLEGFMAQMDTTEAISAIGKVMGCLNQVEDLQQQLN